MKKTLFSLWLLVLSFGTLLVACPETTSSSNNCQSDAECTAPGTRCSPERKQCICTSDQACERGFFCNRAGVCQQQAGCALNSDCTAPNTYCDAASGQCLDGHGLMLGAACGLASHCPYNTICTNGACVAGCYSDGDCQLGLACVDGQCLEGVCSNDGFCGYGERCSSGHCQEDRRGPYCRRCTFRTAQNPEPCDEARNFCLVNTSELGGFTDFCGVDCSLGQECPNGYDCSGILILTQRTCFNTAECRCNPQNVRFATATCTVAEACNPTLPNGQPDPNAGSCLVTGEASCNGGTAGGPTACFVPKGQRLGNCLCDEDADCESGGCTYGAVDDPTVGSLCCTAGPIRKDRDCRSGEGDISGYCSCATDDDCPRDNCDGSRGACAITGRPCTPGNDDCGPIPCITGACLIGANCAPLAGLSCSVVLGR